ncbi:MULTISPECIES: tRNA guanosine(15) transglycosylase TgtA [Halobacterium]|uniref:tRNA guanosine(15) transglycosylase TgtA n=1 Tax=Halobacterium TaxID=2239 RepID=UPI0019643DFB|nr:MULTISPECIES: tRNA guanosine(15) transglycosylase TgtA [Halobacterium]MDL0121912.1 tRNA guanosine(15) transglycosylase TgtA [Halobacterium salinarum]MDL0132652.1 tRNA guanosine(15) transglycosylase TgtA [Halobacterium salinarum]QRY24279.1 tRNA guanosine(15) transglycosylase TgtA [Halobacterium sp. BOL4-2]
MRDVFEVGAQDGLARIGELDVPRAGVTVETPTLMPVVNPNLITVEPSRFVDEFGAELLITNSYIINSDDDLRERALDEGLHEMLGFDGAIMTDSGSFQLAEYGEIDTDTEAILRFQHDIGSDIGTPVDIPTPPDADREQAAAELETTQQRLELAETVDVGDMLVNAPVQGATQPDLREQAGAHAYGTALDLFPVGAVVPLMNQYRYDDMTEAVLAAKRGLGRDAPVHLFGAGHPMMFALAAALGCDLFDSAAYAIYARDDRYLTVSGTEHLDDLHYFPCDCPVCAEHSPQAVRGMAAGDRERLLAEHNLHVSFGEIRRVKQAIKSGTLMELVAARAHAHPSTLDGYRALLDHSDHLEASDPASKDAFFYTGAGSARRPEVHRHHQRLDRLDVDGDDVLLTEGDSNHRYDESWNVLPPFGPYPSALATTYPLTAETPARMDRAGYEAAAEGVCRLAEANPDTAFTLAHDDWPESALEAVPQRVSLYNAVRGE